MNSSKTLVRVSCLLLCAAMSAGAGAGDTYYQTKTSYAPQQRLASYEAAPAGFVPVYTGLVARHGSRGLSSMKYDLAVYNMWLQAQADGALTPLGERLGPAVMAIMKANFLLGYGVEGISNPGYGNETQRGIQEHKALAGRLVRRLPGYWARVAAGAEGGAARQVQVVTSGVDRAVDSGHFFTEGLLAAKPQLAPLLSTPPAPAPYPDTGAPVGQPDGTNRFLLYFHKLTASTDKVTNPADPYYATYSASQAYQKYKSSDADMLAKQSALSNTASVSDAGRALLERLFSKTFVDKIADGTYVFANTGTYTFTSDDGLFTSTLTGDGKTKINSVASGGALLYELYCIAPAMRAEAGVDFLPFVPSAQAAVYAEMNDGNDYYDKGPGITEKGAATWAMAQLLQDDLFKEADAIAAGDLSHAARLRFTHAEIMIPLATQLGLRDAAQQTPLAQTYAYANNPWRGEQVSPMAANLQWDLYRHRAGAIAVRMLHNEAEADFKPACDAARMPGTRHFYDYAKLRSCYGY